MDFMESQNKESFLRTLGVVCQSADKHRVVLTMEITPQHCQPFGYLHGGATISLLETAASWAAALCASDDEVTFGLHVDIWHKNPGISGVVTGEACLDHEEPRRSGPGIKQFWNIKATDEEGTTLSEGTFMTMNIPKDYLEKKREQGADA